MTEPLPRAGAVMLSALLASAPLAIAQGIKLVEPAPSISLDTWLNLPAEQKHANNRNPAQRSNAPFRTLRRRGLPGAILLGHYQGRRG